MKHIVSKLFAGFLCMAVLTVGLLWLVQAVFFKDSYLNARVDAISRALKDAVPAGDADYQELEASLNVSLLAVDSAGGVIYMSQGLPMRGLLTRQLPELMQSSAEGEVQYLQTDSQDTRYALLGQAKAEGYIFAVFSLVDVGEASRLLLQQLWIITAVLLAAALVLAVVLSRMFSRPIVRVTRAAKHMAEGKYDVALPVGTRDEIGQLTATLNELGSELKKTEDLRRELIANVSHELRAPLAIIQGFAETVRDVTWPDEEKRTAQLTMISEEAARLSRVVTDILDYSRLQSGVDKISVSDFPGNPALREIASRYEIEAGKKGVAIQFVCPEITLRFDPGRFTQVVGNLLGNAIHHAADASTIHIRCEQAEGGAKISVENTGQPIPEGELERIWDRYYRAPQTGGEKSVGTGLGLSIVKSILIQHNVPFGVSSDEEHTVFWFMTLPIA